MRADTVSAPLLSSDSHLRGARTVRVASALFPAHASPGRGCAHDPTRNVRGVVCTRNAGRGPLPFSAPGSHAFGFCAAPLHVHGAGQKGGGASPHARTQMEGGGACRAGCVPPPILAVPPTPGPCPNGGATFSALRSRGQGVSRRGAAPSLRRWSTPLRVLRSLG